MEFCPQLSAFQGVLISADNVQPFSRLTSRGGNEEKIQYVIDTIAKFLKDGSHATTDGYKEESIPLIRKFAFFMILNSDLSVLSDMTDMEQIELMCTIPTIPKCLLCEIFWRLHFNEFVYEAIAYCDPELASEISSAFLDNIKYYTPSECLDKISIISSALYKVICRIFFFNFYSNTLTDKLTMLFSNLQKAVIFFTDPPREEKLNSLSKDDLYKYKGKCLNTMLLLVYKCIEEFMCTQELGTSCDSLYTLTYMGSVTKNLSIKPCDCPCLEILDCLHNCHTVLLDKCQELVMGVSVDIFCAWSEFEEDGKTVQRKIGELCHKVRAKLLCVSDVAEHAVVSMIQQISCKPEDIGDIIKNSDTDTIIANINSCEDKAEWIRYLIEKDQLYQNETLVNYLGNNLKVLTDEECYNIYKSVKTFMNNNSENDEYLELFIIKVFQHCSTVANYEILDEYFSNNFFVNMMESDEYATMLTETFNKFVVAPDADLTDILCLFFQNPQKVYEKIFELAIENPQQTNIMINAMKLLDKYSNHYYSSETEPCIIRVTQNTFNKLNSDAKKHNFVSFICGLKSSNSITGTKLLILIIMPHIHKALLSKDIASLNIQCKLLKSAFTLEELLEYRAPMLAMYGQILEVVRWKFNTFVALAPETLQLTLDLQIALFNTYSAGIPDNECSWLKNKLKNLQPPNMYYYRKLWNPPGNNFVEVISGMTVHADMDTEHLATCLIQVICSSTQQEWCNIWDSLTVFGDSSILGHLHSAFTLLILTEKSYHSETKWACVLHSCRNFVYVIRYKYFKEPLGDSQVSCVIEKITETLNMVAEYSIQDLSTCLLPLFAYLAEKKSQYSFDIAQYLTTNLRQSQFTDILTKVFSNGTV